METTKEALNIVLNKLSEKGLESLSDSELVRLITRSRNLCPFLVSESYATEEGFKSDLGRCRSAEEIQQKFGLTKMQATSVLASVELGKRIALLPTQKPFRVASPGDAARYFMNSMRYENHERFVVMLLNTKNHLIRVLQIAEGSLSSAVVHPREVFASSFCCPRFSTFLFAFGELRNSVRCAQYITAFHFFLTPPNFERTPTLSIGVRRLGAAFVPDGLPSRPLIFCIKLRLRV